MQRNEVRAAFTTSSFIAFFMAIISGFTDVFGFVGANKLFTAHITGNIVIAISELIHDNKGVASKLISIPLFILIVWMITIWIERRNRTKEILSACFFMEALFLLGFMIAGLAIFPHVSSSSIPYICGALLAVCAMSIHNALLRIYMNTFPPCTVMTGNLTQFIIDIICYKTHQPHQIEPREASLTGIKRFGNVLLGFIIGGTLAALGYVLIGFWAVLLDVVFLGILGFLSLKNG